MYITENEGQHYIVDSAGKKLSVGFFDKADAVKLLDEWRDSIFVSALRAAKNELDSINLKRGIISPAQEKINDALSIIGSV